MALTGFDSAMTPWSPTRHYSTIDPFEDVAAMWSAADQYYQSVDAIQRRFPQFFRPPAAHPNPFRRPGTDPLENDLASRIMKRSRSAFEDDSSRMAPPVQAAGTPPKRRHMAHAAERAVKLMFASPTANTVSDESSFDMHSLNSIHEISSSSSDVAEADDSSSHCSDLSESTDSTDAAAERARNGRMAEDFFSTADLRRLDAEASHVVKPSFVFEDLKKSPLHSLIPDFLARMEAANAELEKERVSGTLPNRVFEIDDQHAPSNGQYIEMNLGLGVLEEKAAASSSDSESSSNDSNVLQKLKSVRGGPEDMVTTASNLIEEV